MTKFRITIKTVTIDLKDPDNEVILNAKNKADSIMEWAVMFHHASLVFAVIQLILFFTPLDRLFWTAFAMWLTTFLFAQALKKIASDHLRKTIARNMPND